jgi:hypothetical protein
MRKTKILIVGFILFFPIFTFAQKTKQKHVGGESLEIVTYYPSPYGSYNQLNLGAGGLKFSKVVEKAGADIWTDLDILDIPSAAVYFITAIPLNGDPFVTEMFMYAVGPQGVSGGRMFNAVASTYPSNNIEEIKKWHKLKNIVEFRLEKLKNANAFALQIKPKKNCKVKVGKILSYWEDGMDITR